MPETDRLIDHIFDVGYNVMRLKYYVIDLKCYTSPISRVRDSGMRFRNPITDLVFSSVFQARCTKHMRPGIQMHVILYFAWHPDARI